MSPAIREAFYDWMAGLVIGLIPLAAHFVVYMFIDVGAGPADNWSADIAIVSIANSGLSVVSTFTRLSGGLPTRITLDAKSRVLLALTIIMLLVASILYGIATSGHARSGAGWAAVCILLTSALTSLYFEMAVARARIAAAHH